MKDNITEERSKAILKALDEAIEKGPWEDSNFLRVIGRNLRQIRDDFFKEISIEKEQSKAKLNLIDHSTLKGEQVEVYVSLYTMNGDALSAWERVIANLPRQVISRPVYADEASVKNLISSKDNKINEGYVVILVNKSDILTASADKAPSDRFGKPLIALKDKAINLAKVNRFVHLSGTYIFLKGRLVKKQANEI